MRLWIVVLATFPACGFHSPVAGGGDVDGAIVDASPDVGASPSDALGLCFGTFPTVCFSSAANAPTAAVTLTGDIDTGASTLCDQHNDQMGRYCVIAGTAMQLPAGTVRAYGDKPLVLLSTTTFDLAGTLDVSSTSSRITTHLTGPGVVPIASCADGVTLPTADSGGYGGSFGGKGGEGQRQDSNTQPTSGPAIAFPAELRAGCPGGDGATTSGIAPARGGAGGGAVSIIATQIRLGGTINASGAAGSGGSLVKSGAGGGGSGGMIVLDTPSIVAGGGFALFANGGGGGQGGAGPGQDLGAGQSGSESTAPDEPGVGGDNDETAGGAGGDGAAGDEKAGSNAANNNLGGNAGGGGGGGGAGFIRAPSVTSNIAPPSTNP